MEADLYSLFLKFPSYTLTTHWDIPDGMHLVWHRAFEIFVNPRDYVKAREVFIRARLVTESELYKLLNSKEANDET